MWNIRSKYGHRTALRRNVLPIMRSVFVLIERRSEA
jgi:hypothetical protein